METDKLFDHFGHSGYGRLTGSLFFGTVVAVISSFLYGYNIGCLNNIISGDNATLVLEYSELSSDFNNSLCAALFCIGGLVGALAGNYPTEKWGRKKTLMANNIFFFIGAALQAFSNSWGMVATGRVIVGIGSGCATLVVPMYISETSPVRLSGALGTLNQLSITIGILVSEILGMGTILGNSSGWRWLLGFQVFPAGLQILLFFFFNETPAFLVKKGKINEAEAALQKIRGERANVQDELAHLEEKDLEAKNTSNPSFLSLFTTSALRAPLIVGVGAQLAQQLTGINAVFNYSSGIFLSAGIDNSDVVTAIMGTINVAMTVIAVKLMDKSGRRTLLATGLAGMCLMYLLLSIAQIYSDVGGMSYLSAVSTVMVVVSFAIGVGAIPWVLISEIFPIQYKGNAMTFAVMINWLANFTVVLSFPPMKTALDSYVFLPYMGLAALFFAFTYFLVPETKGKSIEEVTSDFMNGRIR